MPKAQKNLPISPSREANLKLLEDLIHNSSKENVIIVSFGYKYGIPKLSIPISYGVSSRFFDTRNSIRNPWRNPNLRKLVGLHPKIKEFVVNCKGAVGYLTNFMQKSIVTFIDHEPGKDGHYTHLFVIGCHGGRHRSVALAELLKEQFDTFKKNGDPENKLNLLGSIEEDVAIDVIHLDLDMES